MKPSELNESVICRTPGQVCSVEGTAAFRSSYIVRCLRENTCPFDVGRTNVFRLYLRSRARRCNTVGPHRLEVVRRRTSVVRRPAREHKKEYLERHPQILLQEHRYEVATSRDNSCTMFSSHKPIYLAILIVLHSYHCSICRDPYNFVSEVALSKLRCECIAQSCTIPFRGLRTNSDLW